MGGSWLRLTLRAAGEREEELAGVLWEAGTLGLEVRPGPGEQIEVDAYFRDPPPPELEALDEGAWRDRGAVLVGREPLPAIDWLARYRDAAAPFVVGAGFIVDPREPGGPLAEPDEGRILLRIPARTAFGIGSHESTRLAVELLEAEPLPGRTILDLGTGTGILALVALRLGARAVVGVDTDVGAALVASQTARLNGLRPAIAGASLEALRSGPHFDVAVANIIPAEWIEAAPAVVARLRRPAALITSGLLAGQRAMVRDRLEELGMILSAERREGEWVGMRFGRP